MEEQKAKKQGGKREGQKYKSLLVWDILQKRTDENYAISLKEINSTGDGFVCSPVQTF